MMEPALLVIENNLDEIEKLAIFVEDVGEQAGLNPKKQYQLNLVLDEIVTNIISYGYPDGSTHDIEISISQKSDEMLITITDDAEPFNPLTAPPAQPELPPEMREREVGGLGIHLVRSLVDRLEYSRKDGRNVLRIWKNLN